MATLYDFYKHIWSKTKVIQQNWPTHLLDFQNFN